MSGHRVHTILTALSFHKKAPAMIEWIIQGKDNAERRSRMDKVMVHNSSEYQVTLKGAKKFNPSKTTKALIQRAKDAMKSLGTTGTPTVFDENFNKINWKTLVAGSSATSPKKVAPATQCGGKKQSQKPVWETK